MGTLSDIAPIDNARVMDLVREAGLDVSDWANYEGAPPHNRFGVRAKRAGPRVGAEARRWALRALRRRRIQNAQWLDLH